MENGTLKEGKNKEDRSLVGRIHSKKKISKKAINSIMAKIWVSKPTSFQEVRTNHVFVITFATQADKQSVGKEAPVIRQLSICTQPVR